MRVAVARRIHEDVVRRLRDRADVRVWDSDLPPASEELARLLDGVDGALTLLTDRIDADLLDRVPTLRVVSNLAVGYDNLDVPACTQRGVAVCTTPDVLTQTTAEFALALMFAVARQIVPAARAARDGEWKTWYPMRFLGHDLSGATLGVVGLGRIGREVARMCAAFGMRVVYHDELGEAGEYERLALDDLLRTADVVTLHVPLTPETRGMIGSRALAMMKPNAILINTARGEIVDTDALVAALSEGRLAGVGLDVTDPEPLPPEHPLYTFERVTIVPHIASASHVTRHRMSELAAENLLAALSGGEPPHCLNPEVLQRG
jgi:glyoxylate reductase